MVRILARAMLTMGLLTGLVVGLPALAQTFPTLTGRIVDGANIIPAPTRAGIETKLADLEQKSGIQLVVATVASLQGQEIEPFANGLFRAWKLGEKTRNNGVLLLIAPNEHRLRIEVGYGLEGTLTDALSKVIISNSIAPRFKTNDFGGGIERGVDDIIAVLTTDSSDWQKRPSLRLDSGRDTAFGIDPVIAVLLFGLVLLLLFSRGFRHLFSNLLLNILLNSGRGGGSGGGSWSSGGSGGFSGGGGSSGGGGASGNW